jgi:hypothetical protein
MCHASSLSVTLFKSYVAFFITIINEVKVGSGAGPAKVVVVGWDDAAVQERTALVRSTEVESDMVAGFAVGAAAVMDLPGPPSVQVTSEKIDALKRRAQEIARDRTSQDDTQISYLETLEEQDRDNLMLVQIVTDA